MAMYNAPGVYIKDVASGAQSITQASSSVGLLIGKTRNGLINVAQKIGSWTEFISKYANGLDTPFMENDYLAYAVHGFFTNGGSQLYIGSVKKNAVKATATSEKNNITATAASEGVWGNSIKVTVSKSADFEEGTYETYDVKVEVGSSDTATVTDVAIKDLPTAITKNSKIRMWLGEFSILETVNKLEAETFTLSGGTDGDELSNSDYENALEMAKVLDDLTFIAIPGQTSNILNTALLAFCDNNGYFPIIDMPMASTAEETRQYRKKVSAWTGALAFPWVRMNDPLTDSLKTVPACGHLMGLYARTIENYGIHKAPAGTNANLRGVVELEYAVTPTELGDLNIAGVIVLMTRPNAGIVAWGARSLNSTDSTLRYVTDGLINLNIKKSLYDGTQYAVFEPNDETLWSNVKATCVGFLETLRLNGTLKGTAAEAYYVIVDDSNNTDDTIAEGQLNIEIGYAPVKPAEFIIIKLAHSIVSAQ